MFKYFILMIALYSSLFSTQRTHISDKQIEKMVLAVLEPANISEKIVSKRIEKESDTSQKKGRFYIQMGAFRETNRPSALIGKLKEFGYRPLFKTALRNHEEYRLLLVGPYQSRADAENSLRILRAVEPDAFVYSR
jgi:cell division septation protein DedD